MNVDASYATGAGTSTDTLAWGGYSNPPGYLTKNEFWNGSSWTEVADLSSGRGATGAAGTGSTSALAAGGDTAPGRTNATEEFTAADFQIKTVTQS